MSSIKTVATFLLRISRFLLTIRNLSSTLSIVVTSSDLLEMQEKKDLRTKQLNSNMLSLAGL